MQPIPAQFDWLYKVGKLPCMLAEALRHFGTLELKGPDNNPSILKWADEIGGTVERDYTKDSIAWCGLFMAICCQRCNYTLPKNPLWALNWGTFGIPVKVAKLGYVGTFFRRDKTGKLIGGHVAFIIATSMDGKYYLIYGGNQDDSVCFTWILASRCYLICRPDYKIGEPASVKQYFVNKKSGELVSENEQ